MQKKIKQDNCIACISKALLALDNNNSMVVLSNRYYPDEDSTAAEAYSVPDLFCFALYSFVF